MTQKLSLPLKSAPLKENGAASVQKSDAANSYEIGRRIYNFRCYFCHGYSGNAKTLAASFLDPKPRNFAATAPSALSRDKMIDAVSNGRKDTAMKAFSSVLTNSEIVAVVDFVRQEFMQNKGVNTRYHTPENGWQNHGQYKVAYPFALGEIAIDTPGEQLTKSQRIGKRIFMSSCITCHDRAKVEDDGVIWEPRAVSYPRNQYDHKSTGKTGGNDTTTGATPYAQHDVAPQVNDLTVQQRLGERLFQKNCAFCHAADGSGKNWIGSFLASHPRNLTDPEFITSVNSDHLREVIKNGLPGTTMSAWKHVLNEQEIDAIVAYIERVFKPNSKKTN